MKLAILVVATVAVTLLVALGAFVIVLEDVTTGEILLASLSLGTLAIGPLLLGASRAAWDPETSAAAHKRATRFSAIVGAFALLGSVAIVAFTMMTGGSPWIPVLFIAIGAVLFGVALVGGPAIRRRDQPDHREWAPIGRRTMVRKTATIATAFVAALVIGFATDALVFTTDWADFATDVVQFAFLAAALTALAVSGAYIRGIRQITLRDSEKARALSLAAIGKAPEPDDPGDRVDVARYAALATVNTAFQLVCFGSIFIAIILLRLQSLQGRDRPALDLVLLVLLIGAFVVFVPATIRRIGRYQSFARRHADLLR